MKPLTENQKTVLAKLRERGADFTAEATERHWRAGKPYYLDSRNSARKGLVRAFNRGNQEATRWRRAEILCRYAGAGDGKSTDRALSPDDITLFIRTVRAHPGAKVRVYSSWGFVPNSYKWPCKIRWIERGKFGAIVTGWGSAQRKGGVAPLVTVNGRGI